MASAGLREELECSICLNLYTDPVTLRCGHNFCRVCIDQVLNTQEASGVYSCPECRGEFQERPALQKNITLCNVVENFLSIHQDEAVIFCTYCVDSPVSAVKSCLMCEVSLCDKHLKVHIKGGEHVLTEPRTSLENRKCPIHKEVLRYYCTEDTAYICVSCYVIGEHHGHKMESLDEASEKKKEKYKNVQEKLATKRKKTEESVQSLEKRRRKTHEKAAGETEKIIALFIDTRRWLGDLEKKVLSEISRHEERVSRSLSDAIQKLEIKKDELSRKMRDIEELCNMKDPLTVLQGPDTGDLCDPEEEEGGDEDTGGHDGGDEDTDDLGDSKEVGEGYEDTGNMGNLEEDDEGDDGDTDVSYDPEEKGSDEDTDVSYDPEEEESDEDTDVSYDPEEEESDEDTDVSYDPEEEESDEDTDVSYDPEEEESDEDTDVSYDPEEEESDEDTDDLYESIEEESDDTGDLCDPEEGSDEDTLGHGEGYQGLELVSHISHALSDIIRNVTFYVQDPADILLDVKTTCNNILISEDLKTATWTEENQNRPDTAERFQYNQMMSSRGFTSGRHYWDVEIGISEDWRVGMCYTSIDRKGRQSYIGDNNKSWGLCGGEWCSNQCSVIHDGKMIKLPHEISSDRFRIYLDYEAGQLSFYELCDPIRHLHTFTASFTEPLHAVLCVILGSIKILEGEQL